MRRTGRAPTRRARSTSAVVTPARTEPAISLNVAATTCPAFARPSKSSGHSIDNDVLPLKRMTINHDFWHVWCLRWYARRLVTGLAIPFSDGDCEPRGNNQPLSLSIGAVRSDNLLRWLPASSKFDGFSQVSKAFRQSRPFGVNCGKPGGVPVSTIINLGMPEDSFIRQSEPFSSSSRKQH